MMFKHKWQSLFFLAVAISVLLYFVVDAWRPWPVDKDGSPVGNQTCSLNLHDLYNALNVYISKFGAGQSYPPHHGEAFWLCLAGQCGDVEKHPESYFSKAPLAYKPNVLHCPIEMTRGMKSDAISYRGPTKKSMSSIVAKSYPPDLPLACEKPNHHPNSGGWVLHIDGSVLFSSEMEYEKAFNQTE